MSNKDQAIILSLRSAERCVSVAAFWMAAVAKDAVKTSTQPVADHREEMLATLKTITTEAETIIAAARRLIETFEK